MSAHSPRRRGRARRPSQTAPTGARRDGVFEAPPDEQPAERHAHPVDAAVREALHERGLAPAPLCSDAVFLRRAALDLLGALPAAEAVRRFLGDSRATKRVDLVDRLLGREEYADAWSLHWGDLLRVKSEFPINLWPNGVQAYARWIRDAVREDRPLDRVARQLITASGSSFRTPAVNFARAVQEHTAEGRAAAFALTFLGERFDRWPAARRRGLAAFFSRLLIKRTDEWKEEVVIHDPAPAGPVDAVLPDGERVRVPAGVDPRRVLADWLLAAGNPRFARAMANRIWAWLVGRGVVHEPDDFRADNPPVMPALLDTLTEALQQGGFRVRPFLRFIATSRTYQASPLQSAPRGVVSRAEAERLFACATVRRLDAEVLLDALCRLDGRGVDYVSTVPEPFTILPGVRRSVALTDGTVTNAFLEKFGRPARDTGLWSERSVEETRDQRLFLLNSSAIHQRITRSPWLRRAVRNARRRPRALLRTLTRTLLSRDPTAREEASAREYATAEGRNLREAAIDLTWALVNSKEFCYRH